MNMVDEVLYWVGKLNWLNWGTPNPLFGVRILAGPPCGLCKKGG